MSTRSRIGLALGNVVVTLSMALAPAVSATLPDVADVADVARWWRCSEAPEPVECAWLEVPIDYADPESATIRLLTSRMPALDDARRAGVLVTIAGGPGQRGTDGVRPGAHTAAIHDAFDVVSWDPRGTSHDSLVDCIPEWDPYGGLDRTPDSAIEQKALDERTSALATGCREAHGDLLPFLGTLETAMDLERLRQMLGEPQFSILGSSYGSQVALLYATLFPDRVRAIVVDGYSDPNISPGEREVEQAAAYEREFGKLLAQCAADPECSLHGDGDPGLALDRLLERLDEAPILAEDVESESLTQSDAHEAIVGYLTRDDRARHRLLDALASADLGHGGPLLAIAHDVRHSYEASGLTQGVFMASYCADTAPYWNGLSSNEVADLAAQVHEVAPRLGPWLWSPPGRADLPPVGLCAMQGGVTARPVQPIDAAGAGPILVVAAQGDPSTPISAAQRATEDLERAVLLTLAEDHHLAYHHAVADPERPAYRCVLDAVEAYLIDLDLPPAGAVCTDTGAISSGLALHMYRVRSTSGT